MSQPLAQSPEFLPINDPTPGELESLLPNMPSFPSPITPTNGNGVSQEGRWQVSTLTPRHREIMRRLLEGATYIDIAQQMGLHKQTIYLIASSKLFVEELKKMESEATFQVIQRADALAGEALDVLKLIMRTANQDAVRKSAADSILDRAGYSKIEKKIIGIVSGEEVIRELNRRRRESALQPTPEAQVSEGGDAL